LCLGFFCTFLFGQDEIPNQQTPPRTTPPEISTAAQSTTESDESAPLSQLSATTTTDPVDAPSATPPTTCAEKNGKPCPEWLHKLIGQYPPIEMSERWNGQSDHFFTLGNGRRTLHPDKKSWMLFTLAQAGMWASTVVAVRDHRTSQEQASSEYPAVAFMTGMDFLLFKTISPAFSVGPPVYAMVHYSRAAEK